MNYELAKKLKDAGFFQDVWTFNLFSLAYCAKENCCKNTLHLLHDDNDELALVGNDYHHRCDETDLNWVKCPTLSELIEACGNGFDLERFDQYKKSVFWIAKTIFSSGKGNTPEEAVANLWLELNKK